MRPMNSIRLIIFTVRVQARCFRVDDGSQSAGYTLTGRSSRTSQVNALRHQNTACCGSYLISVLAPDASNPSAGHAAGADLRPVGSTFTSPLAACCCLLTGADSAVSPSSSLPWRCSPALLFVSRVHLFFLYIICGVGLGFHGDHN